MTIETWSDLPLNLELSRYEVSTHGRLRNKRTNYMFKLKPTLAGYIQVGLKRDDDINIGIGLHILVAKAFLPNPEGKSTVDHINRVRDDNRVENLRWATHSEQNKNQSVRNVTTKSIRQLTRDGELIKIWSSVREAIQTLQLKSDHIAECCVGSRKTFSGFRWEYHIEDDILLDREWTRVPLNEGYEPIYVSRDGYVKKGNKIWKGNENAYGYLSISVRRGDEWKDFRVHRLIAFTFLPSPTDGRTLVNHKDGNKMNNNISNLEWATHSENAQHAHDNLLSKGKRAVIQLDMDGNEIQRFSSITDAFRATGVYISGISQTCRGTQAHAKGYKWKYVE